MNIYGITENAIECLLIQESFPLSIGGDQIALLLDLHRQFPNAVIRGHNEMPGAVPKFCHCYKPSKEYAYMMKWQMMFDE